MTTTTRSRRSVISPEAEAFGRRLRAMREARGLTARWVGREAGVSADYLGCLELGYSEPTAGKLAALADVLGTTLDELWRGCERA